MLFNFIVTEALGFVQGKVQSLGKGLCWAEIMDVPDEIGSLIARITYDGPGMAYTLFGGVLAPLTSFDLNVPVAWKSGDNGPVPHTRQRGVDNMDVIVDLGDGRFRMIMMAIVTRRGNFYVTSQVTFEGQAIRTEEGIEFFPAQAEYAYPGMDFDLTFQSAADRLRELFTEKELPTEMVPVEWHPKSIEAPKNRQVGHVMFWNAVTGTGNILGVDGHRYFFHFRDIQTAGPFKALGPMAPVIFREHTPRIGNGPQAELITPVV